MPAPKSSAGRSRFVLLTQQTFALAVVGAVAFSATGVVDLEIVSPHAGSTAPRADGAPAPGVSLVATAPVSPSVRTVPFGGLSASVRGGRTDAHPATPEDGAQRISAISPPEPARGYATVGVTWAPGVSLAEDEITVSVRTKQQGGWSAWQEMHYDAAHEPDPGSVEAEQAARPGTDAVVVGDVDEVQVRAATPSGEAPAGLALAIVDPGQELAPAYEDPAIGTGEQPLSGATAAEGGDPAAELSAATVPEAPRPTIYSRAQWGADESLRSGRPSYGDIHAGFVHHTVNANEYDRDEVPDILRGIYAYHTRSRGWSDVGYNFLVDRFGRIWEGRAGGVDRPVIGAHTLGYNDDSFAMSAIGNFDVAEPSRAMIAAYGRLFAWKLSLHGIRAGDASQPVNGRSFRAINGHRDAGSTACPGRYLYERLPSVRRRAARLQRPVTEPTEPTAPTVPTAHDADLSGSRWPDLVVRDKATRRATIVRTAGQLAFERGQVAARGWRDADLVVAPGDVDGDRVGDLLVRDAASGRTWLHPGDGAGGLGAATRSFQRFARADQLTGVGDFDGDSRPDVVGRRDGSLLLWRGISAGGFAKGRTLAQGWTAYDATVGVADFDEDGHPDLVARSGSTLFFVGGTGRGVGAPVRLPGGWRGDLVAGRGDATGDGHPDLVVRQRRTGATYVVAGDGAGGLGARVGGWPRFASARWLALAGQLAGNRRPDLVGWSAATRDLRVFANSGRRNLGLSVDTGISLDSTNLLLNVGDWNGDGRSDLMARRVGGAVRLYAGTGRDGFAAPTTVASDWRVRRVHAAGDVTGDGFPDLLGQDRSGDVRVYPNDHAGGFGASSLVHPVQDGDRLVGVGLFDGDAVPDTVVRRSDGTLWLWSGAGPGGLGDARRVGAGADRYDWIRGYRDVDGGGLDDLVVRSRGNGALWLLPGTRKGFAEPRLIAPGFDAYDLLG